MKVQIIILVLVIYVGQIVTQPDKKKNEVSRSREEDYDVSSEKTKISHNRISKSYDKSIQNEKDDCNSSKKDGNGRCKDGPYHPKPSKECLNGIEYIGQCCFFYKNESFPHPKYCDKYYKCDKGKPTFKSCPKGWHWNAVQQKCRKGRCFSAKLPRICYDGTISAKTCCLLSRNARLADPTDCRNYCECGIGPPKCERCPIGLYWSIEHRQCIYEVRANCGSRPVFSTIFEPIIRNPSTTNKTTTDFPTMASEDAEVAICTDVPLTTSKAPTTRIDPPISFQLGSQTATDSPSSSLEEDNISDTTLDVLLPTTQVLVTTKDIPSSSVENTITLFELPTPLTPIFTSNRRAANTEIPFITMDVTTTTNFDVTSDLLTSITKAPITTTYIEPTTETPTTMTDLPSATPYTLTDYSSSSNISQLTTANLMITTNLSAAEIPDTRKQLSKATTVYRTPTAEIPRITTDLPLTTTERPTSITETDIKTPISEAPTTMTYHLPIDEETTAEMPPASTYPLPIKTSYTTNDLSAATTVLLASTTESSITTIHLPVSTTDVPNRTAQTLDNITDRERTTTDSPPTITDLPSEEIPYTTKDLPTKTENLSMSDTETSVTTTKLPETTTGVQTTTTNIDLPSTTSETPDFTTDLLTTTTILFSPTTESPNTATHFSTTTRSSTYTSDLQSTTIKNPYIRTTTEIPTSTEETPTTIDFQINTEIPTTSTDLSSTETYNTTTDLPTTTMDVPVTTTEYPISTTDLPSTIIETPHIKTDLPTTTGLPTFNTEKFITTGVLLSSTSNTYDAATDVPIALSTASLPPETTKTLDTGIGLRLFIRRSQTSTTDIPTGIITDAMTSTTSSSPTENSFTTTDRPTTTEAPITTTYFSTNTDTLTTSSYPSYDVSDTTSDLQTTTTDFHISTTELPITTTTTETTITANSPPSTTKTSKSTKDSQTDAETPDVKFNLPFITEETPNDDIPAATMDLPTSTPKTKTELITPAEESPNSPIDLLSTPIETLDTTTNLPTAIRDLPISPTETLVSTTDFLPQTTEIPTTKTDLQSTKYIFETATTIDLPTSTTETPITIADLPRATAKTLTNRRSSSTKLPDRNPSQTTIDMSTTSTSAAVATPVQFFSGLCAPILRDCRYGIASAEKCCEAVPFWLVVSLQNNENCSTYFQCVQEKPEIRNCPNNLKFSAETCRCERSEIATCTA